MPGVSWCTRCCSCAFYHYQEHTRPRVQRASGIPHALHGGERFINGSGAMRREREVVCGLDVIASEVTHTPSFRGDANGSARSADPLGPSRNDGYGFTRCLKIGSALVCAEHPRSSPRPASGARAEEPSPLQIL